MKNVFSVFLIAPVLFGILLGCTSAPKLDPDKIRPWSWELAKEYPQEKVVIAHYKQNGAELLYLAAHHTSDVGSDTLNMVNYLFEHEKFNALLIEPIPFSSGESPAWFLAEAKKGKTATSQRRG